MTSSLTSFYRSLARHRVFAALNIGGLALGVGTFLVLFLYVRFEASYDWATPDWRQIWVVQRTMRIPGVPAVAIPSRPEMLAQFLGEFPGAEGVRVISDDVAVRAGLAATPERMALVDPGYFTLFPYPIVAGDPAATLGRPDGAVVTASVARAFLGDTAAIGRTLAVMRDGRAGVYRVGAVIADLPAATTYQHDIFVPLPPGEFKDHSKRGLTTFLRFASPATAATRAEGMPGFVAQHPDPNFSAPDAPKVDTKLAPLASLHLAEPRDRAVVAGLGAVGLLALFVAIINYVNLATARAGLRAREVAIRKVAGGTRVQLARQFLGEAIAAAALATLIGLALAELALPLVNAAGGTSLDIAYWGGASILWPALGLTLGVGLIAGAYPALALSRFQPAAVLASARAPMGSRKGALLRRTLVIIQFSVATALMIATGVLAAQTRHLQASDLGFRRANLVMAPSFADPALDDSQRRAIVAAIAALPGIAAVGTAAVMPTGGSFGIGPMHRTGASGPGPMVTQDEVGPGFFTTYGARLIAGRLFDSRRFALDDAAGAGATRPVNLVLNRSAIAQLGFASPAAAIGQTLRIEDHGPGMIVGVIADMRFRSPRDPVDAQAYFLKTERLFAPVFAARFTGDDPRSVIAAITAAWRRIAPAAPARVTTVDRTLYESFYRADARRSRLFIAGATLAALIGCLGLYGLAASDTARRVREIGIRKTLGATTQEVLGLLVGQFLGPVLLANLIAWPLAFVAMRQWLAGFDDRIALSPWFFVGASVATLLISILTVVGHAWRVARAEPARALRYE